MTTQTFLVMDKYTNDIEYIIKKEALSSGGVYYKLYRSNSDHWSSNARGEHVLTIEDTGNGLILGWSEKVKKHTLEYTQAETLRIILNFENTQQALPDKYRIFPEDESLEI